MSTRDNFGIMRNRYNYETVQEIKLRAETMNMVVSTSLWLGIGPVTAGLMMIALFFINVYSDLGFIAQSVIFTPSTLLILMGALSMVDIKNVPVDTDTVGCSEEFVREMWGNYFTARKLWFPDAAIKAYVMSYAVPWLALLIPGIDFSAADFLLIILFMNLLFLGAYMVVRVVFICNLIDAYKRLQRVRAFCIFQM